MTPLEWIVLLVAVYQLYRWANASYDHFERRGIPYVKSPVALLGSLWYVFTGQMNAVDAASLGYKLFPGHRLSGFYTFRKFCYLIHDPELVKQILVQDFGQFTEHTGVLFVDVDPLFGRALFFMKGGLRWRHARIGLSPEFSGSKLRNMFGLMASYAEGAVRRLVEDARRDGRLEVEIRDLFQKLGNDVMTSLSVGVEIDSVHDPGNEFLRRGKQLIKNDGIQGLKFILLTVLPARLSKMLKIRIISQEMTDFYVNLISITINQRKLHNIVRPDFIDLLVQARKNLPKGASTQNNSQYSDFDIAGAASLYYFGGLETTTSAICFALYEICLNLNVKQKLQSEIDQVHAQHIANKAQFSYEVLRNMKYLDMVLSETLRKWPLLGLTNRSCTKPYTLTCGTASTVTIEAGDHVQIPIRAIHWDPRFYPEPDRFDQERFSDEHGDGHRIRRSVFLPFGSGPRNCIGSRLALMHSKCLLYYVLAYFDVQLCDRTDVPLKLKLVPAIAEIVLNIVRFFFY